MKHILITTYFVLITLLSFGQNITQAEYFIDTDPGVGNGTAITVLNPNDTILENFTVPTAALSFGPHFLWVRTRDNTGSWSIYDDVIFYVSDTTSQVVSQPQLVGAEYFWDTDPGVGLGTVIPVTAGDTIQKTLNINTAALSVGIHYLYIRTVDQNGKWSLWDREEIDVQIFPIGGIYSDSTAISCFGGCDASAIVTPTGGTPGWTFAWYTDTYVAMGITDSTATGLCAGNYHCVIEDALGDKDTIDVTVNQPPLFAANPDPSDATCGNDNGIAAVIVTGGTAPFDYLWGGGETTATLTALEGNIVYPLTLTDANGCTANANVYVPATPAVSVSAVDVSPSCHNICDGQGIPTITGGTAPFDYYWSDGSTNDTLMNACSGTYTVTVTDAAGCIDNASITITNPSQINPSVISNNANCGDNNGNATVSVTGGQTPYSYSWSSGDNDPTADTLAAGTYTVTITDAGGCVNFATVLISDANGPTLSVASANDPTCFGSNDGSIDMTVGGGVLPFTFSWSNGESTEDIAGLLAGPYEITATDANGCSALKSITLTDPNPMSLSFSITQANCGNADGIVSATVAGGTAPFVYSWSTGGSNSTEAGVPAGIHTLTVTDANNCVATETYAMSELNGPDVTLSSVTNTTCGFATGSIDIDVTGGTGTNFTYSWSNAATTEDISGLGAGLYEVTVTDQANCSGILIVNIPAVQPLQQDLCLVTVDTLTNTNKVVWTKPTPQGGLESYNIYRETSSAGVYQLVGNVLYANPSEFTDPVANPTVQSYRYKVSAVDTCGNESTVSSHHKTIHLTLSQFGGDNYINWDHYEGFTFPSYTVWWVSDQTSWTPLVTVASNVTSYTHTNPIGTNLDYFVEAVPYDTCVSELKAISYGSTRSNKQTISGGVAPPIADFTETGTSINIGQSIIFTDASISSPATDDWLWTFTGGTPNISNQQNPTVTYNTAGVYDVKFIAYNSIGSDTITKFGWITVTDPGSVTAPVANFVASSTSVNQGGTVDFTDISSNTPTSWQWFFTNGTPSSSTTQSPTGIQYNTAGTFDVTLIATNSAGSDTETKSGFITVAGPDGIDGLLELNSLLVFPNPADDNLFINMNINGDEEVLVELLSMEGKLIETKKVKGAGNVSLKYDVENLATGTYLLRLTAKSGSTSKNIIKR
jgi:PKD repeat protein